MRWKRSLRAPVATWRLLLLRSVAVLGISIAALPWPNQTLARFVVLTSCIALASGVLDAVLFHAIHRSAKGAWTLLPEAIIGVTFAGALVVYPRVPLPLIGALLALWVVTRSGAVLVVTYDMSRDMRLRTLSLAWSAVSVLAVLLMLVEWSAATMLTVAFSAVGYGLLWGTLELAIALRLRAYAGSEGGAPRPAAS